ncbi:MAG TPA: hypothetical protein VMA32_00615 [Streptosporangiaceae bacterium]|nr:hypothetical protein [Streptosporangiaceae bacterium]
MPDLIPGAGPGWETALLLPVPATEPAVREHRARLDEAVRDGVPAHITVLNPFVPLADIASRCWHHSAVCSRASRHSSSP